MKRRSIVVLVKLVSDFFCKCHGGGGFSGAVIDVYQKIGTGANLTNMVIPNFIRWLRLEDNQNFILSSVTAMVITVIVVLVTVVVVSVMIRDQLRRTTNVWQPILVWTLMCMVMTMLLKNIPMMATTIMKNQLFLMRHLVSL